MTTQQASNPSFVDNNMIFAMYRGGYLGLNRNNKKANRSANVLIIGGTGTGKTFKYIKPNILQENCSIIVTDPSGDIFRSFAPYLLTKGYNVFLFNASDFSMSNHYNPLLNVYDANGEISERHINILVDLYMKNAKAGKEAGGGDPFWDKSEKAFLTAIIYYVLENDEIPRKDKCFATVLQKVQMAKVDDESEEESPLTQELNRWFQRVGITEQNPTAGGKYKCKMYYDTFRIAPQKTANTILITTAVDLQIFATKEVDFITREDEDHPQMNINIDTIATQQSYLFLGIPQSHQAYNFLIAMLYSQLYGRLYELGEQKLRGKWHIGYRVGTPVFDYFDSEEEAKDFYEHINNDWEDSMIPKLDENGEPVMQKVMKEREEPELDAKGNPILIKVKEKGKKAKKVPKMKKVQYEAEEIVLVPEIDENGKPVKRYVGNIEESDYINGTKMYSIVYKGRPYKSSVLKEPMEKLIEDLDKMYIWSGDEYAGGDPSLPIHINFLLDEFKNIGEIPNFLTILATSRKYRIGSHVVIQGIDQLKTMYKENEWGIIPDNCDTTLFLGVPDIDVEDKEYIQKALGKTTILQKSVSDSKTGRSTTFTPTQVDLVSMDEIDAINSGDRDDCFVIVRGSPPFLCRKLLLTEHRRWKDVTALKDRNKEYVKLGKQIAEEKAMPSPNEERIKSLTAQQDAVRRKGICLDVTKYYKNSEQLALVKN